MPYPTTPWTDADTDPGTTWTDADGDITPSPCDLEVAHGPGQRWIIADVFELICQIGLTIDELGAGPQFDQTP